MPVPVLASPSYFGSSTGAFGGGLPVNQRDEDMGDDVDLERGVVGALQGQGPGLRLSRSSSDQSLTPPGSSASNTLRWTGKGRRSSGDDMEGSPSRTSDEGGALGEMQRALGGVGTDSYRRTGSSQQSGNDDADDLTNPRQRPHSTSTSQGNGRVSSGGRQVSSQYASEDSLPSVQEGEMAKTGRLRRFTNMIWPISLTKKRANGAGRRKRRRQRNSVGSVGDFASRGSSDSEEGNQSYSMGLEMRHDEPHTAASRRQRAVAQQQQQFDSELQRYGRGRPGLQVGGHKVRPGLGPSGAGNKGPAADADMEAGQLNQRFGGGGGLCSCLGSGGEGEAFDVMLARVWFGILLSVIERPEPTNVLLRFLLSRVYPAVYLAFQFLQLSATNDYLLPPIAINRYSLSDITLFDNIVFLTIPKLVGPGLNFVTGAAIMAALLLFMAVLALQFRKAEPSRLVIDPLAGLLSFFSTIYYMPFIENMSTAARLAVESGDALRALVSMLCLLLFVPFCLFVSQNKFQSDVNSSHLLSRRHNRVTLVLIAVKTGVLFTSGPSLAWVRLLLLLTLFVCHFLTYPYYSMLINRLVNGLYAVLVLGAASRLICVFVYPTHKFDPTWLSPVDRAYWWLVLPVFLLGLSLTLTQLLGDTRETCNDWVVENVNLFDMADRAEVIERFGYSYLLHSATRMGRHARFLARGKMRRKLQKDAKSRQELLTPTPSLGPDESWEEEEDDRGGQDAVEAFFHKALRQDPQHAQNLAWYGDYKWLVKGELEEARALYERAVRAQPRNRHLLESLAHFLNANPGLRFAGPQSLACYQKAVQQHRGHSKYSKFYVNSSDPALIISSRGQILDCNGAALHVFRCRGRSDLCGKRRLFDLLHAAASEAEVRQLTDALRLLVADKVPSARLQTRVATLRGQHLDVQMLLTVVYRGRGAATGSTKGEERTILYAAMSDVTEMKALLETNRLVFENSQTCMIMVDEQGFIHKYNKHAEQTFGYRKSEMEGSPDGRVPRANISRLLPGGIASIKAQNSPPKPNTAPPEPMPTDETGRPLSAAAAAGVASPPHRERVPSKSPINKGTGADGTDEEVHVRTKRNGVRTCLIRVKDLAISGTNYYIVTLNDISNLKEAMELNVRVFEDSLLPMLMLDGSGRIQRLNKAAVTMTGYPADRLQQEHFKMLLDCDWARQHEAFFRKYFQGRSKVREVTCDKVPLMTALQEARLCTLKLSEIRAGTISLFLLLLLDMTEMHSLNLRNELTFELAMVAMVLVDKNGAIEAWNKQAVDTFQYSAKEVRGRGIDLIFARQVTRSNSLMRRSLVGGGSFRSSRSGLNETGDEGLADLLQPRFKSGEPMPGRGSVGERTSDLLNDSGKEAEEPSLDGEEDNRPAFMLKCGGLVLGAENEVLLRRQDGQIRACVVRVNDMVIANDKVLYIFCITDITDMKEAHELSDKVFDKSMTAMFMIDESGRLQRMNQAATTLTQYPQEEALNMSIKEFLEPEVAKHQDMFLRRLKIRKGPRRIRSLDKELKLRVRDGSYRTCKLQLSELEVGVYRYFVGMLIDVTQIKELNELSEKTFQNALAPMFTLTANGTIKAANKKAHQIFGFSTDYLLSRGLSMDIFMPSSSSSPPRHSLVDGQAPPRGEARSFMSVYGRPSFRGVVEGPLLTRQGRQRGLFTIRTSEVKVADKVYYVCCLQDVTELREAAETNRLIFEKSGTAMMILNTHGVITRVNEGAMSLFGFGSLKEAEGRQLTSLCIRHTDAILHHHNSSRHLVDGAPRSPKAMVPKRADSCVEPMVSPAVGGRRPSVAGVSFDRDDEDLDPLVRAILLHSKDKGDYEIKMLSLDGQELSCLARISRMTTPSTNPTHGSSGGGNGFILTLEDITRVKEAHELQSQIFELGSEPMIMLSETGVIEDYNLAAEDAFGYDKDETIGENITMLMADQKHVVNHHSYLKHYVESGDRRMLVAAKDVTVKTKDGRCRIYSVKVSELWVAKTRRFVGIFHDITELPNLNSTSRLAYQRYEEERTMRPDDALSQTDKDVWNDMVQADEPLLSGSIRARIPSSPQGTRNLDKPPSPGKAAQAHAHWHVPAPIVTSPHGVQHGGLEAGEGSRPSSPAGIKEGTVTPP